MLQSAAKASDLRLNFYASQLTLRLDLTLLMTMPRNGDSARKLVQLQILDMKRICGEC